MIDFLNFCNLL